jgi:signal recognition particle subunit SRP54
MFEQVSSRLQGVVQRLWGVPRLHAAHVDDALRDLRLALLEADVHFRVVKDFCRRVREQAVGEEILASLTAPQQVVKILKDELLQLMGASERPLELGSRWPAVVVLAGLAGSGKTTTAAKLGLFLSRADRHPALGSVDTRRPAAIEQLRLLASQAGISTLDPETSEPAPRARAILKMAEDAGYDTLVLDTAGRVHLDQELMRELTEIVAIVKPVEILFVADAMTGQDAVKSAEAFGQAIPLTGHVLSKLDGDARGGAALSIVATTGKPIKFAGVGEKLDALEVFRPERMVSRILGMGDVLTLIERAEAALDRDQAVALSRKLRREELTLEDFRQQLSQMRRMGSLRELLGLIPGLGRAAEEVDESELTRYQAILDSMTLLERTKPAIIDGSRRRRIASGSGSTVNDVNRLLRRFAEARKMARQISRGGGKLGWLARFG